MTHSFALTEVAPDPNPLVSMAPSAALELRGVRGAIALDAGTCDLVETLPLNGFLMAVHTAYTRHRALTLSPDAVWLCIAQGLARHVNEHAEQLRARLVRHEGKLPLDVRNDALAADPSSVTEWGASVEALTEKVREHIGGRASLFAADFSTTDRASRVASQITLLGAVQQYFEYTVHSLCGVPAVTLEGTVEDWRTIRERVRAFQEFDLAWWAGPLDAVLAKLEETARGNPDRGFWEEIYKLVNASGGELISGWVNALFPYVGDAGPTRNPWFEARDGARGPQLPKMSAFATGMTAAQFTWRLAGADRAMRLVAGFVGVKRAGRGDGVAPAIGWAVTPAAPERAFRVMDRGAALPLLTPRNGAELTSLAGLAEELEADGHTAVELMLWWCPKLVSLEGAAEAKALRSLNILGCDALCDLRGLERAASLRSLVLAQCANLTDLYPLARLTALEELQIARNPKVLDYAPIATLPSLTKLGVFGSEAPGVENRWHTDPESIAHAQAALKTRRRG